MLALKIYRAAFRRMPVVRRSFSTTPVRCEHTTRLKHFRIASSPQTHEYPTYNDVERLQSKLQRDLLSWKAESSASFSSPPPPPPSPSLISFTPQPTYTLGRRQTSPLEDSERARLTALLTITSPTNATQDSSPSAEFTPAIINAPRGGLATYHGPGQVVLWPVIDLHSPLHKHFSVRDYACLLEKTTIATLAVFGLRGFTTDNPGVWVNHHEAASTEGEVEGKGDERKVSALGVHLRRHVTGLGVAINFSTPVTGPESTNPWARIVACGLGDKGVTSISAESKGGEVMAHGGAGDAGDMATASTETMTTADVIAGIWADQFAERLGLVLPQENGSEGGGGLHVTGGQRVAAVELEVVDKLD